MFPRWRLLRSWRADLHYRLLATFMCCLSSCGLVFLTTYRCKVIWLQTHKTCLTVRFTLFFLVLLWSTTSAAILLRVLCILWIFPNRSRDHLPFGLFTWLPTALTCSFVRLLSCFMKSSCLVAASFDLQMLSVLSISIFSSLSSRTFVPLSWIPITILFWFISSVSASYLLLNGLVLVGVRARCQARNPPTVVWRTPSL